MLLLKWGRALLVQLKRGPAKVPASEDLERLKYNDDNVFSFLKTFL